MATPTAAPRPGPRSTTSRTRGSVRCAGRASATSAPTRTRLGVMAKGGATTVDRTLATRKLLAAARGARLCYGEPVHVEGRTVIPVARVRAAGGLGQRGGGGRLDAVPVGFIEVSASGARGEVCRPRRGGDRYPGDLDEPPQLGRLDRQRRHEHDGIAERADDRA